MGTQLAYEIYDKGFKVAKAAPESFRDLLRELLMVKCILYRVDQNYAGLGRQYDEGAVAALQGCRKALISFQPLLLKYEKLGEEPLLHLS